MSDPNRTKTSGKEDAMGIDTFVSCHEIAHHSGILDPDWNLHVRDTVSNSLTRHKNLTTW